MAQPNIVVKPEDAGASTGTTPAEVAAAIPAPANVDMELPDAGWNAEISDNDFDAEDAQVTPNGNPKTPEAAPAKPAATESDDDDEDDDDDEPVVPAPDAEKPKDAAEAATVAPTADGKPLGKEARIAQLKAQIAELEKPDTTEPNADVRLAVAERNLAREQQETSSIHNGALELEQKLLDQTNPETGEAYTPQEAATMARRAEIRATQVVEGQRAFTNGVAHNQQVIQSETRRAMQEFPMFVETLPDGTPNPAYDEAAANLAGEHLLDAYVMVDTGKTDKDGKPIQVVGNIKRSPYEILKSVATQAARYKSQAEATARTAADAQSASADVPVAGNTTPQKAADPGKDFDDEFDSMD